jgi:hypothetical protein
MFKCLKSINKTIDLYCTALVHHAQRVEERSRQGNATIPKGENIVNFSEAQARAELEKKLNAITKSMKEKHYE